jgi:hypothetical protein
MTHRSPSSVLRCSTELRSREFQKHQQRVLFVAPQPNALREMVTKMRGIESGCGCGQRFRGLFSLRPLPLLSGSFRCFLPKRVRPVVAG